MECPFKSSGELNTDRVSRVPAKSGVYAIATKTGSRYNVQYVGRSGRSMRGRVEAHLKGRGNKVLASLLDHKKQMPSDPTKALYVAYWETTDHKLVEAMHISASARPVCNLIRGSRLPEGLREADVVNSPFDD